MKKMLALIVSLIAIFILTTAVLAEPEINMGGDFQLKYVFPPQTNSDSLQDSDFSQMLWWEFQVYSYKNFGDNATAFLKLKAVKDDMMKATGYGYTYKFNDALSLTWKVDADGELLADTQVMSSGCDWHTAAHNDDPAATDMNLKNALFVNRTVLKLDTNLLPSFNLALAYGPEAVLDDYVLHQFPAQFLIKGKYSGEWFSIGGGWTNFTEGYVEGSPGIGKYRPLYAVYGEIFPSENFKFYWEYMEGEYYLTKGTYRFDPFTLKATYGDISYGKVGHTPYVAYTLDAELDYALSENKTIIFGLAYLTSEPDPGLSSVTVGLTTGPLTVEAQHDFDIKNNNANPSTSVIGKYNLDGTNTLEADFNLDKKEYTVQLYIYFW